MDSLSSFTQQSSSDMALNAVNMGISLGISSPVESYNIIRRAFFLDGDLSRRINNKLYMFNPADEEILETCPICHTDAKEATPFFCAFSYNMSDFRSPFSPAKLWMKCDCCGNLFTYGWPKGFLHPKIQPQKTITPREERKYEPCKNNPFALFIHNDILRKAKDYTSGTKLLEVGIGVGGLAAVALEMEYDVTLVEIEESVSQTVADLLEIPVICTDFLQYQTDEKFDVISMGDVIEHVTDPHAAMEKVRGLLSDNGVVWLSTPNFESSYTKMMKFDDPMYMEPYHITWFSKKGIETLLDDCGLKMVDYKVSNRYNGSMELFIVKK
jgi:SAM-dependent methyltransferase